MLGAPRVRAVRGLLGLRLLVRLCHLRGRHRHLLGAIAHPGVPGGGPAAPARRGEDRARSGRDRLGLGLPVRAGRHDRHPQPGRAALLPGLVSALLPQVGAGRCRGGAGRRLRQAVPGEPRSQPPAGLRHPGQAGGRGRARQQRRDRRPADRIRRHRVHGARPRLRALDRGHREHRCSAPSETGTPIRVKDVGQVGVGPELRRGVSDLDGTGEVVSGIVVMRQGQNALEVIDRVKAKLREIEPGLPPGVEDRSGLRPLRADHALDRHPEVHARRGHPHGRHWSCSFSCGTRPARSSRPSPSPSRC